MWRTGNNGQIGGKRRRWKYRKMGTQRKAKGDGGELDKIDDKYNMNITNARYNPKNNNRQELITWGISGGKIEKHLDYIAISNKSKNWIKMLIQSYCEYYSEV